jgi:hypothetical protein
MAKARMLHKKISLSKDVGKLLLPAQLLFTWMISHADDEGRLYGDPITVKATVVPRTRWSPKLIKSYLDKMSEIGLIYYWQVKDEWFIEFCKWKEYQQIRKDRFEPSKLPSFNKGNSDQTSTDCQPINNQSTAQENINESNVIEINKSEYIGIADDETTNKLGDIDYDHLPDPSNFSPSNESELAAKDAWLKLEPDNNQAFYSTYLNALKKKLPADRFYIFVSEIQKSNANNPGAVFNTKFKDWLSKHPKE